MGPTCLSVWVCGGAYTHTNVYVLVGYVLSDHCGHYFENSLYTTSGAYGAHRTVVAVVFTIKGSQR